ncbi:histidine phosphatase family protein [Dehalococcoides mccartyi]|jgi:probable phosphoglycerate mutase|uniref:histidine phosphatase family protein n=1 Tax=Dehalococcoides mccartyi TaxID=61435 RepID=UPI00099B869E|nr:histidine phosphatase family protein [Dehalococcoides mccartyi]AQX73671.1 phosphoglycerate mutase [Dehalococcoides mccartyi]AQX75088.1 phosphoglycerate mutase [Dehalococcoides mccartyi]AQY73664.1 phosphoglycerate mutase [Dehalococcoides mccartyi]
MTRIYLIRHGETDWNNKRRLQGGLSDTPLNENGLRQTRSLALRLKDEKLSAIYASPLSRAKVTAEVIALEHGLAINTAPDLREIEAGEFEGVDMGSTNMKVTELFTEPHPEGGLPRIPGGESLTDVQTRAWRVITKIAADHPDQNVAVVCHYFVILSIICKVLVLPLEKMGNFRLHIGSLSLIEFKGNQAYLALFNENGFHQDSRCI